MIGPNSNTASRPMTSIESPEDSDVPMGRGGFVNSHPGHRKYMKMVQDRQLEYVKCRKADKMEVAWCIVRELRALNPPARFLRKDAKTGRWNDVGDKKFREKVSQALREHQPFIKAVIECNEADSEPLPIHEANTNINVDCSDDDSEPIPIRPTRRAGWDLPTLEQKLSQESDSLDRPSAIASAGKRRAFLASRTETNVTHTQSLPVEEDLGFNLSEFSVSQGPSFPDFEESAPSRRNSSGLDGLFAILNDNRQTIDDLDALLRVGLSPPMTYDNQDYLQIETMDPCRATVHDALAGQYHHHLEMQKRPSDIEEEDHDHTPVVKRCTLSRDKSEISRQLKEMYCTYGQPEAPLEFGDDGEGMESLLNALEKNFPFPSHDY